MKVSIVIPAYNEERCISHTLTVTSSYLDRHWPDYEIIVVNNRSTDSTRNLVQNIQHTLSRVILIDEPVQGKGAAVKAGMRYATRLSDGQASQTCVFMDADNSTSVSHLEIMLPYLEQGYDVVIGSIAVAGARIMSRELWYRILCAVVMAKKLIVANCPVPIRFESWTRIRDSDSSVGIGRNLLCKKN